MNTPIWDYSELLEEAKDRIEEKLILEGEIKYISRSYHRVRKCYFSAV